MTITSCSGRDRTVLTLSGAFDFQARQELQSVMRKAERHTPHHIVLDMENVISMNCTGVALIKQLIQQSTITKWTVTFPQSYGKLWGLPTS